MRGWGKTREMLESAVVSSDQLQSTGVKNPVVVYVSRGRKDETRAILDRMSGQAVRVQEVVPVRTGLRVTRFQWCHDTGDDSRPAECGLVRYTDGTWRCRAGGRCKEVFANADDPESILADGEFLPSDHRLSSTYTGGDQ